MMKQKSLIETILEKPEYQFLQDDPHLGGNIMFLTFGGSLAYGTNLDQSDIDIRGVTGNLEKELLGMSKFEQVVDAKTDTTIYGFMKFLNLLMGCNPKAMEMIGCKEEDYTLISRSGQMLLDNKKLFFSKKAILTFGVYAQTQLRIFQADSAENPVSEEKKARFALTSCAEALPVLESQYHIPHGMLKLGIVTGKDNMPEIRAYFNAKSCPENRLGILLKDLNAFTESLIGLDKQYSSFGKRNKRAKNKSRQQLNKHVMHLIRQYRMVFDVLEDQTVRTYRDEDHDLLMSIRNGAYMKEDGTYTDEFFDMVSELDKRFQYDIRHTELPDLPDQRKIEELAIEINRINLAKEKEGKKDGYSGQN